MSYHIYPKCSDRQTDTDRQIDRIVFLQHMICREIKNVKTFVCLERRIKVSYLL